MARAPRRKKYSGVLAKTMKPIVSAERKRSLVPVANEEWREGLARSLPEFVGRMTALCEHYRIDVNGPAAGWALAYALARDHVPGFKFEGEDGAKKRGAGSKWDDLSRTVLWLAFRAMLDSGETRESAGAAIFESEDLRRHLPEAVTSGDGLARQYEQINSQLPEFLEVLDDLRSRAGVPYAGLLNMLAPPLGEPNK